MSVHAFPASANAEPGLAEANRHLRAAIIILRAAAINALRRMRTRRHLGELEPYLLRDIGLTRLDATAEAQKPFWRA